MTDNTVVLPPFLLTELRITEAEVVQYPELLSINDKLMFAATDACRKGVDGTEGTIIQMINKVEDDPVLLLAQMCLFLVKNKMKPMANDLILISELVLQTAQHLREGHIETVNRRAELIQEGFLKPDVDDVAVPAAERTIWVSPATAQ